MEQLLLIETKTVFKLLFSLQQVNCTLKETATHTITLIKVDAQKLPQLMTGKISLLLRYVLWAL